ncbi:epsin-like ENTH domain-containing protein [Cryptosporidium canis]|uniref:Epsin-like ENTH domain-containing protein n=1 Tax=Cryptosporidium canis TaxID=195482 RepID=A0A9D5DN21_9CRYT|nr:epsin-like ENTH domain-containing protein [Cryptosporidium canis]
MSDRGLLQSIFSSNSASAPSGYQLNEVAHLSYMQEGCCNYLEDYLIKKLKRNDPKIKFKALRLIKHLCENGNPTFKMLVQRHASQIRFCQSYKGAFDPVYGDALSELVREEAVQCLKSIFSSNNRSDEKINVANQNQVQGSGANGSLKNSYRERIHGFGNPNFVDRIEQGNNNMDISQIGNSIVFNAKIGQYNQVVDDLSELVLKVLPNKLFNGISNYYNNTKDESKSMNSGYKNKYPSRRDFRDHCFDDEISRGGVASIKNHNIPIQTQRNFPEHRIEENKIHFSKPALIVNDQNTSSGHTLETNFVENYCSVTGLILNPSNESLQNSIKEIQKLDIPVVIKMLHNKLVNLCNNESSTSEQDYEKNNSGSEDLTYNHLDINEEYKTHSAANVQSNPKSESKFKIVYKILCLFLFMLEKNKDTNMHLIEYASDDFTRLLNQISSSNSHCRKKVRQITEIISTGASTVHAQSTPQNKSTVELTNNLLDIDIEDDYKMEGKVSPLLELNDSLVQLPIKSQENSDKKNNLFKNLSIKNYANRSGSTHRNIMKKIDGQANNVGSLENTGKSLVDLGIL